MDNFIDGESAGAGVIDDLRDRVERDVVHVLSDMAFGERRTVGDRRGEEITEDSEAFRVEIALGLRLDRKDRLRPLDEEVDFRIAALRGPVAGREYPNSLLNLGKPSPWSEIFHKNVSFYCFPLYW